MPRPPTPHVALQRPTIGSRWAQGLRESNAASWLAALLFVAVPFVAANIVTKLFLDEPGFRDLRNLIKAVVLGGAYWAYVRWWERRRVHELSAAGAAPELLAGLLLGGLLFAGVMGALAVSGVYTLDTVAPWRELLAATVSMLPRIGFGALIEELIFRLLLLRLLERSFGTVWALLVSSLLFGLAHLGNAGATPLIGTMLGLELGLLFGAAYLLTRRLWLCTGMHLAWNFVQGVVFSVAVSGHTGVGWLQGRLAGPAWLTGGAFGVEASIVSFVVCVAASGVMLKLAHRRGRFG